MSAFSARLNLTSRLLLFELSSFIMPVDGNPAAHRTTAEWVTWSEAQGFKHMVDTVDNKCAPGKVRALQVLPLFSSREPPPGGSGKSGKWVGAEGAAFF